LSREIIDLDNIFDKARDEFREDMEDKNRELTKMQEMYRTNEKSIKSSSQPLQSSSQSKPTLFQLPPSTSENSSWKNWNTTLFDVTFGIKSIPSVNKPLRQNLTKCETRIDNNRTHHGSEPSQKVLIATLRKQNKNDNDNHIENGVDAITYVGNTTIHDTKNMPDEKKNTNAIIANNTAIINTLCDIPSRTDNKGTKN